MARHYKSMKKAFKGDMMSGEHYGEGHKGVSSMEGYAGMESRDRNQYKSGEFVSESRNGYADMPQQVEYKKYAETPYGLDHYLDDGIGGIDNQVREDRDQVRKGLQPRKY